MQVVSVSGNVHIVPVVVVERAVRVAFDQVCAVAQVGDVMKVAGEEEKRERKAKGTERFKEVERQINHSCDEEQQGHTLQGIINCLVQA